MQKYRLEYAGIAKSWTFDLFNGQRITLSKDRRVYVLPGNSLSPDAIKYYRTLAPQVKLLRSGNMNAPKAEPAKAEKQPEPKQEHVKAEPVLPKEIVEEVKVVQKNDPDPVTESDYVFGDRRNSEELSEIDQNKKDCFSEADLCEYLDLNKSEEEVRELAQELGVNVKRLRSKDSIIARLVGEKFEEVLAKLNL